MENTILERELLEISLFEKLSKLFELESSIYKDIELSEDDEALIQNNMNSRRETYSLLNEILLERDTLKTKSIIEEIDKRILSFNNIDSFKKNENVTRMFKDDIDELMASIEQIPEPEVKEIIVIEETSEESDEDARVDELLSYIDERIRILESELEEEKNLNESEYTYFGATESKSFEPTTQQDLNSLFDPNVKESEENNEDKIESYENLQNELRVRASQKLTRDEIDSFIKKIDDKLAELEAEEKALSTNRFSINMKEF